MSTLYTKKSKDTGNIVKFTGKTKGVIVEASDQSVAMGFYIGYSPKKWIEHTNTDTWEDVKKQKNKRI